MKIIFIISLLIFVGCLDGGYNRRSFLENDNKIDIGRRIAEKAIISELKKENQYSLYELYPLEVYCQYVNGINFKFIYAALKKTGTVRVFSVFLNFKTGSDEPEFKEMREGNKISNIKNLDNIDDIIKYIDIVYKNNNKEKNYSIVNGFKNIFDEKSNDRLYFIRLDNNNYCFVYKNDQEISEDLNLYKVDYIIRNFKVIYN